MGDLFNKYGNLMFYKGHQIDYFYFSSLLDYQSDDEDYNELSAKVAAAGQAALANPPFFQEEKDMPALEKLSEILSFLKQAVQYERANEITYFKQKLAILKDSFSKEEFKEIAQITELEKMFSNTNEFDYNHMIVLINILMQGLKETKAIAKYEEDRIEEINNTMKRLHTSRISQLTGLWDSDQSIGIRKYNEDSYTKFLTNSKKRFDRRLEIEYSSHGNLASPLDSGKRRRIWGAKKYLSTVPKTVDVTVANWITSHITEIFNSDKYTALFNELAEEYVYTGKANTSTVREMLVKSIVDDGVKHTAEILDGTYKNLPADEFIKTLTDSLQSIREYNIKGYYPNFGQKGRQLKYFSQLDDEKMESDGLFDAYRALCEEITARKKITKEENMFMASMKQSGNFQTYNRIIALVKRLEIKEKEFAKVQRQIREGRHSGQKEVTRVLELGASRDGEENVKVKVKITADKIECEGIGEAMGKTSLIKKLGNGRSEATTIKGLIAGMKSKMSRSLKDDIYFAIMKILMNPKNNKTKDQIGAAFEKALTGLKLTVGGPTLSEIAPAILAAEHKDVLQVHFPGKLNRRNDLVTITLTYQDIKLESTLADIMETQAKDLVANLDPELEQIQKQYIVDFEDNFYTEMGKLKNTNPDFNSLAKNEEIWFNYTKDQRKRMEELDELRTKSSQLWADYEKEAKESGISEKKLNQQREAVLNSLKDSFYISKTMKTYNQYQNNLGFGGPSLGASVGQQLSNLNTLFTKAGAEISKDDLNWLQSAIINCSPVSIVGESNKNIIENYLGSMAAFAIFDEGAAEAQIIQDLKNKVYERVNASPKILHLYRVNGVFVPGSVVLERTIEELSKCVELGSLAIQTVNRGAGITIINTMNYGLIPNRSTTIKRYKTFESDPWGVVGAATDSHVKLKIMFLAGLMDIVNSMNKAMGNVELP